MMMNPILVTLTILSLFSSGLGQLIMSIGNVDLDPDQVVPIVENTRLEFDCRSIDRRVKCSLESVPTWLAGSFSDYFDGVTERTTFLRSSGIYRGLSESVLTCNDGAKRTSFIPNVLYIPSYYIIPIPYKAKEGDDLFSISALIESNPAVMDSDTVWRKNGSIISESDRVQLNSTTITITNINRDDSGEYTVQGSNSAGSGNVASFDLEVYFGPDFISRGGNIEVDEGEPLQIDCTVADSNPVIHSITISGYGITGSPVVPYVLGKRIQTVTEAVTIDYNGRSYTCTASNGETMTSITYTVTVIETPEPSATTGINGRSSMPMQVLLPSGASGSNNNAGTIAGIVIGAIVGLAILVGLVIVIAIVIVKVSRHKFI